MPAVTGATQLADELPGCAGGEQRPNAPCPACNARRRHAVRLVEGLGLSVHVAAERMRLPVDRVERLLEEEADRRAVAALRLNRVSNAALRQRFRERHGVDPRVTA